MANREGLLTAEQVAEFLQVSVNEVKRLRRSGELRSVPIGRHTFRFTRADVEEFIARRRDRPEEPKR